MPKTSPLPSGPPTSMGRYKIPGANRSGVRAIARELAAPAPDQITIMRYQSLDLIGHYFLRYAMPSEFGDVTDEERRGSGSVLEQHYGVIDDAVGRAMGSMGPDDLLLMVSGYGMEPMGIVKRLSNARRRSGFERHTRSGAGRVPDGVWRACRPSVVPGPRVGRRRGADDLYFLGLPIGRDMDGTHERTLSILRSPRSGPSPTSPRTSR